MRRRLHGRDERFSGDVTSEAPEFLAGDHNHLIASVNGDVLRSFAAHLANEFAEASLGVL
jgi:hypothetical protein